MFTKINTPIWHTYLLNGVVTLSTRFYLKADTFVSAILDCTGADGSEFQSSSVCHFIKVINQMAQHIKIQESSLLIRAICVHVEIKAHTRIHTSEAGLLTESLQDKEKKLTFPVPHQDITFSFLSPGIMESLTFGAQLYLKAKQQLGICPERNQDKAPLRIIRQIVYFCCRDSLCLRGGPVVPESREINQNLIKIFTLTKR